MVCRTLPHPCPLPPAQQSPVPALPKSIVLAASTSAGCWVELGLGGSVPSTPSRSDSNPTTTPFKSNNNNTSLLFIAGPLSFLFPPLLALLEVGRDTDLGMLRDTSQRHTVLLDKALLPQLTHRSLHSNTYRQTHKDGTLSRQTHERPPTCRPTTDIHTPAMRIPSGIV